jgi:hypothetical protein
METALGEGSGAPSRPYMGEMSKQLLFISVDDK